MLLNPIRKQEFELRVGPQLPIQKSEFDRLIIKIGAGAAQLVGSGDVVGSNSIVSQAQGELSIPDREAKLSPGNPFSKRAPVILRPVAGVAIDIKQQVID